MDDRFPNMVRGILPPLSARRAQVADSCNLTNFEGPF